MRFIFEIIDWDDYYHVIIHAMVVSYSASINNDVKTFWQRTSEVRNIRKV